MANATKQDLKNLESKLDERFEILTDTMGHYVEGLNSRLDNLEEKFDRLLATIDKFIARIDTYETEMTARDARFERLLGWAKKVSKKTGVPLEDI